MKRTWSTSCLIPAKRDWPVSLLMLAHFGKVRSARDRGSEDQSGDFGRDGRHHPFPSELFHEPIRGIGLHSLCRRDRRRPTGSQFTAECSSERLSSPHCSSLSPIKNRLAAPCDLAGRTQRCGGRDPVVLVGNGEIGMASQSNSAAASIGNWKPEIAYPGQAAAGTALRWPTAH